MKRVYIVILFILSLSLLSLMTSCSSTTEYTKKHIEMVYNKNNEHIYKEISSDKTTVGYYDIDGKLMLELEYIKDDDLPWIIRSKNGYFRHNGESFIYNEGKITKINEEYIVITSMNSVLFYKDKYNEKYYDLDFNLIEEYNGCFYTQSMQCAILSTRNYENNYMIGYNGKKIFKESINGNYNYPLKRGYIFMQQFSIVKNGTYKSMLAIETKKGLWILDNLYNVKYKIKSYQSRDVFGGIQYVDNLEYDENGNTLGFYVLDKNGNEKYYSI